MQNGPFLIRRAGASSLNCWYTSRAHRRESQHLLQPLDINPVPDHVDGKAMRLKLCG